MIPDKQEIRRLLRKYSPNDEMFALIETHGRIVADIALWCVDNAKLSVDKEILEATCLLHDIGSYVFIGATNFNNDFEKSYPGHAIFGAKILQDEGVHERIWRSVETHVLAGLSAEEIKQAGFKLPEKDYLALTTEAELLCYADRFHSKKPTFNDLERFISRLDDSLPKQAAKIRGFADKFGVPDINRLAEKYNHPIR